MNKPEWIGGYDNRYAPVGVMLADIREGRLSHAYLFYGPAGTGKRTLAELCARAIHCRGEIKPCGECPPCMRHESGNHPDYTVIDQPKSIGVDAVRDLISSIGSRPYEGGKRVVVIKRADSMTVQAQNALLKTLEAPPEDTIFFLIAENISALLPTIISRARPMRFKLMSAQDAEAALVSMGYDAERAALLADISGGSVGRALEIDRSESYWAIRARVAEALKMLDKPSNVGVAFMTLKDDKDHAGDVLDIIESWGRALMLERAVGGRQPAGDMPTYNNSECISGKNVLQSVIQARRRLKSNVSWQSAVEMLFLDITGGRP